MPKAMLVLLAGSSCTGKSTFVSVLRDRVSDVVIIGQDEFYDYDSFNDNTCPMISCNGHAWKNWESPDAVDWGGLIGAVRKAKARAAASGGWVVVEGFLLLQCAELVEMADILICLEISKEALWQRRKARAEGMRGLPEGPGDNTNYEVLSVYAPKESLVACERASRRYAKTEKELAWMRLYFEEVLWPAAEQMQQHTVWLLAGRQSHTSLAVDACKPVGKKVWAAAVACRLHRLVETVERGTRVQTYRRMMVASLTMALVLATTLL